jgi:hypothetical protein
VPVAAAVIGDPPMPAVLAGFNMAAHGSGAAGLDRRHHLELGKAQMPGMGSPISRPCKTEDIGDLKVRPHRLSRAAACPPSAP